MKSFVAALLAVEGRAVPLLQVTPTHTEIGCDAINVPDWVWSATHIGAERGDTDGIILTLCDKDAEPLGRLVSG